MTDTVVQERPSGLRDFDSNNGGMRDRYIADLLTLALVENTTPVTQENPFDGALFASALATLPTDPRKRLKAVLLLQKAFRRAVASVLQPVVQNLLQNSEFAPTDDAGRKALAIQLNEAMRETGLAIIDPQSGSPTTVVAQPNRLLLRSRVKTEGAPQRARNARDLLPLKVVEHIRQEVLSTWHKENSPSNRQ